MNGNIFTDAFANALVDLQLVNLQHLCLGKFLSALSRDAFLAMISKLPMKLETLHLHDNWDYDDEEFRKSVEKLVRRRCRKIDTIVMQPFLTV